MLRALAATLAALLLSSCFDIREEIWVAGDGSGRARIDYTFPSRALAAVGGRDGLTDAVHRFFEAEPALRLDELSLHPVADGQLALTLRASTDSMRSLAKLTRSEAFQALPRSAADLAGDFKLRLRGLDLEAERTVNLARAVGLAALAIDSEQRATRRVTTVFHLPTPCAEHNASRTENDGRTLVWEHSLGEALGGPIVTRFRARIPVPWWAYPIAVMLVLLPAVPVARWFTRRRRLPRSGVDGGTGSPPEPGSGPSEPSDS